MELHMPPLRPPPYTATIPAHHTEHHCLLSPRHFTTRRDTPNNMHTLFNSSRGSMCSPSRVSSTPQQPSTSRRRANIAAAAAAGRSSGGATISLKRFADAADAAAAVVTERRAADVAVLGSSTAAVLAAYTLAKSGRKVVLLPDLGLSTPSPLPRARPHQPLKLPDPDPMLTHLATESAAYWGGLQMLCGAQLLAPQRSLDVVLDPERDHAGAAGFSKLQESCAAVGVPFSLLSGSEVSTAYHRALQLPPHRSSGLLQPEGGVLRARQAAAAVRQLATNVGVMIRDGLALRGWRDRGSCFELRASSMLAPDAVTCLYEAEVLLLAPGGAVTREGLALLGLSVEGLQVRELVGSRLSVSNTEQLPQLPLLHTWGAAAAADAPQQPEGFTLLPSGLGGDTQVMLQQQAAWGLQVPSLFEWQPARFASMAQQQGQEDEEEDGQKQRAGHTWADLQVQQLHASCSHLLRGLAPLQHPSARHTTSLVSTLPDGRPLVDSHPGFEPGRVVVCCGLVGSEPYGPGSTSSSFQLSPILAKMASDVIKSGGGSRSSSSSDGRDSSSESSSSSSGNGGDDSVLAAVSLQREGLAVSSSVGSSGSSSTGGLLGGAVDTWEGLGQLQQRPAVCALQLEEQQDLARDAEQDLIGSRQ